MTGRQREILELFAAFIREHRRAPTIRELLAADGRPTASTNGMMELLVALQREGMLDRTPGVSRGWYLTPAGEAEVGIVRRCPHCGGRLP